MRIRTAREADLDQIIHLLNDDELGRQRESTASDARSSYVTAFRKVCDDPRSDILVARDAERILGCVMYTCIPGLSFQGLTRLLVEDLRVAADARRRGIARALMHRIDQIAAERGCGMIELFVHAGREPARAFYESLGFESHHLGLRRNLPG